MEWALAILGLQGVLGGYDNFRNHEFREGLPIRTSQWKELYLHTARQVFYLVIFPTMAWFTWGGIFAYIFGAVIVIELFITCWDFIEEDRTRKLPPNERILHTMLTLNYGIFLGVFLPILVEWSASPTAISFTDRGLWSWLMTIYSVGVLLFACRECSAGLRLHKQRNVQRARSVHEEAVGEALENTVSGLAIFHKEKYASPLKGKLAVKTGSPLLVPVLRFMGLPCQNGLLDVTVHFMPDGLGELWTRDFRDATFTSRIECASSPGSGTIKEFFGPFEFHFGLTIDQCGIHWDHFRTSVFSIPLPALLSPKIYAEEKPGPGEDCYWLGMSLSVPVFGLLLSYEGFLSREEPDLRLVRPMEGAL